MSLVLPKPVEQYEPLSKGDTVILNTQWLGHDPRDIEVVLEPGQSGTVLGIDGDMVLVNWHNQTKFHKVPRSMLDRKPVNEDMDMRSSKPIGVLRASLGMFY